MSLVSSRVLQIIAIISYGDTQKKLLKGPLLNRNLPELLLSGHGAILLRYREN